jgi:hypothetical protein
VAAEVPGDGPLPGQDGYLDWLEGEHKAGRVNADAAASGDWNI